MFDLIFLVICSIRLERSVMVWDIVFLWYFFLLLFLSLPFCLVPIVWLGRIRFKWAVSILINNNKIYDILLYNYNNNYIFELLLYLVGEVIFIVIF